MKCNTAKYRRKCLQLWEGKRYLRKQKALTKQDFNKIDMKIVKFHSLKDITKKMKSQFTTGRKYLQHMYYKGLETRLYKILL